MGNVVTRVFVIMINTLDAVSEGVYAATCNVMLDANPQPSISQRSLRMYCQERHGDRDPFVHVTDRHHSCEGHLRILPRRCS